MALEEVSFINMVGDEVKISNLVLQMINYYLMKLEVGETKITDFNEGSEIRNLLEAFAVLVFSVLEDTNEATKLPFISSSYGVWLDKIGENPFISLPRIEGSYATGLVTFTLTDAQSTDVTIPAETLLEDINGLEYVTDEDCIIYTGETSTDVSVTCLTEGADGNVKTGELNSITDENIDTTLVSVYNNLDLLGGADYEDDDEYRERLLSNVRSDGFGTYGYYSNLGASVDGVHDVSFVSYPNYTSKVLVNGDMKPTTDEILLNTLAVYTDVNNIVLNHNFIVDRPTYVTLNLSIDLSVVTELDENTLTEHLTAFFNGGTSETLVEYEGLNIGQNITGNELKSVFEVIDAITNISISESGSQLDFDTTEIDDDEVLKLGTVSFNQTVIS